MDRPQWNVVFQCVKVAARTLPRDKRLQFPDWLVVAMFLWAVDHDRPMSWACERSHYGSAFRPRKLPSVSQFTRRVKTERVRHVLQFVHQQLACPLSLTAINYVDGKPLVVGVASKDPDAAVGRTMSGFARGYKLHAFMTEDRRIPAFSVLPLNAHEMHAARQLLPSLPRFSERMLLLADGSYDAKEFYNDVAERGGRLLSKPRGMAEHPSTRRQMGPTRREAIDTWRDHPSLTRMIYAKRIGAEGTLSNLTSYGGGLGPLPAFVRRLPRVRRWVGAKLILYHARLRTRREAK